ncbi:uncharacterized protein METZ01_LOCUS488975, partial [marine metagenome]
PEKKIKTQKLLKHSKINRNKIIT